MKISDAALLKYYIQRFGKMTSQEALAIALDAEHLCRNSVTAVSALRNYKQEQLTMETYAQLLEQVGE